MPSLLVSLLALGLFWAVVYEAPPLVAALVTIDSAAIIGVAFLHAGRNSR